MPRFRTIAGWGLLALVAGGPALQAQVVRQLTDMRASFFERPRVTDDGSALFVASTADLTGSNPEHRWRIFRFGLPAGAAEPIGSFALASSFFGLSDDGQRLAFVSQENLTGANPDRGSELFVMNVDGSGLAQLTDGAGAGNIFRVEMSGSGQRVVFDADFDYAGLNPGHTWQVFAVEADGTNLRRLSVASAGGYMPSISDDGLRVVYTSYTNGEIQAVEASGLAPPRALTTWFASFPVISGDGSTVVFLGTGNLPNESDGWCQGGTQVGAIDWDGTNPTKLSGLCLGDVVPGSVYIAEVTDDGQTIFYVGADLFSPVRKVNRDASQETMLATGPSWYGAECWRIGAAGGGSRIGFTCEGDPASANPDLSLELYSATGSGASLAQRTSTPPSGDSSFPALSRDSRHVVFQSDANPLGEAPAPGMQLYRAGADGAGLLRLTDFDGLAFDPAVVTANGNLTVVPVVDPPWGELRRLYTANAQTGIVSAITAESGTSYSAPSIDDAGSTITAVNYSGRIYRMAADGSGLTQLLLGNGPRLDGPGQAVVFSRLGQVRRMGIDGSGEQVLATGTAPDVSRSGAIVVYESSADPLGTNADGNQELFSFNATPPTVRQLTSTVGSQNQTPAISGDGRWVYHRRTDASYNPRDLARVDTLTLAVERVTTFETCWTDWRERPIVTNHDGSLAAFHSAGDCSGDNPDGNMEVFVVDYAAPWRLFASGQPTRLEWGAAPGVARYDVVRGELAQLGFAGPAVSLGAVTCLHDDLPLNGTDGDEDGDVPEPGAAFFYLVRGAAGGYGQASSGAARVAGSGDCPD